MSRLWRVLLTALLFGNSVVAVLTGVAAPASAAPGQVGAPQVTINPGGGNSAAGADGLRIELNRATNGTEQIFFRGSRQYYYDGQVSTMLNIGGTLFGQAGPAGGSLNWSSLTVVSTTGTTTTASSAAAGSGTAVLRYVATKNGLQYSLLRTITYTYPNDFFSDTYEVTIPAGNTEAVKVYQGGDTAPGDSDVGFGILLTSPVRQVISLNPDSRVQVGYREIAGGRPFDGATSRYYASPYDAVQGGGDIGFSVETARHDAGIMVQWNLGSLPGRQTVGLETFVNTQGANLQAGFDRTSAGPGETITLEANIVNTLLTPVTGLGFTLGLPAGVAIAGTAANTCGGNLVAAVGSTTVALDGGSAGPAANCVISIPVAAQQVGSYVLTGAAITSVTAVRNSVGTSSFEVTDRPVFGNLTLTPIRFGTPFSQTLAATTSEPVTYAVTDGALPGGLALDPATGVLSGTPNAVGQYNFTVTASSASGSASRSFVGATAVGSPAVAVAVTPTAPTVGQAVGLRADLPADATGTLTFRSGTTTWCTTTLPDSTCAVPAGGSAGTYPVTVDYSGDGNYAAVSVATTFDVSLAPVVLTGGATPASAADGEQVTLSASVTPVAATGTVTLSSGSTVLCSLILPDTSCTVDDLDPGTYPVTAAYSGDSVHASVQDVLVASFTVRGAAAFSAAVTPAAPLYGDSVTVTITAPADATGTVTVDLGDGATCTLTLPATGCSFPGLPVGVHEITATYSGDAQYEASESVLASFVVGPAPLGLEVAAGVTAPFGQGAPFTLTGVPDGASGVVSFSTGATVLCTVDLGSGARSCSAPAALSAGTYPVAVHYPGDVRYQPFSGTSELTVTPLASSVVTDPAASVYGASTTVTVLVSPAVATGTVTVTSGDLLVCTVQLPSTAGCTTPAALPAGNYPLTVDYPGDGDVAGSRATTSLTVARATSGFALAPVSGTVGEPTVVTLPELQAGATGTVIVAVGDRVVCTLPVGSATPCTLPTDLPAGGSLLTVAYSGDSNHTVVTATTSLTLVGVPTAVTVVVDSAPTGGSVAVSVDGLPADATGTILVTSGAATVCTIKVTEDRQCAFPVTDAAGTVLTVTVTYSGDDRYAGSSTTAALVVERSIVPISGPAGPVATTVGQPATVGATGLPADATGTVTLSLGDRVLCSYDPETASGCTLPTDLPAGTSRLTIAYSGDTRYDPAETTVDLLVSLVVVASGALPDIAGAAGTEIIVAAPGLLVGATGTVAVLSGEQVLCSYDVATEVGCDLADLGPGTYAVVLQYSGDGTYAPATWTQTLVVSAPSNAGDGGASGGSGGSGSVGSGWGVQNGGAGSTGPVAPSSGGNGRTDGHLATTGASVGAPLGVALVLLLTGAGLLVLIRRRPSSRAAGGRNVHQLSGPFLHERSGAAEITAAPLRCASCPDGFPDCGRHPKGTSGRIGPHRPRRGRQ